MKEIQILKIFLLICISMQIAQSLTVDKWHKAEDLPTFFIDGENKYNWYEAWNECAVRNMTLIAIDTPEKHSALNTILRKKFVKAQNLWLGGHDLGETGKYFWSSTGKRFDFSNWSKGNPDNFQNSEHCAHIWEETDFEWNDAGCAHKMGFICEENRFQLATRRDLAIKKQFIDQLFAL